MKNSAPVWQTGNQLALPPLLNEVTTQVCVVGLGGAGLACIQECARLGLDVVGLDAAYPGAGASGRNGGFLLAGLQDFYHRACDKFGRQRAWVLYRLTLGELQLIAAETPECVRITGSLRIAHDEGEIEDCKAQLDAMQLDALPAQWYEGSEGQGLLIPTDGVFQPFERCRTLAHRATQAGAQLSGGSEALSIEPGLVTTRRGQVRCKHVIVAVDGGLERIFPVLEGRLRTARLQALATAPVPDISFTRPVYTRYGYDYWQQLPDQRVVLGGLRDSGGEEEWADEADPTAAIQHGLDDLLARLGINAPVTHRWAGLTAYTVSGLPLFEQVADRVLALGGYGGTGNVLGSLLGRYGARWAAGESGQLADLLNP